LTKNIFHHIINKIVSLYFNHFSRSERAKPVTARISLTPRITDGIGDSRMVIAAADVIITSKLPNLCITGGRKKWINDFSI
jgi:hypothetical protein